MTKTGRLKIKTLTRTCLACPSQWEGLDENDIPIYIRYRWGYLSIRQGKRGKGITSAVRGKEIFGRQIDKEGWGGFMSFDELRKTVKNKIILPLKEKVDNNSW